MPDENPNLDVRATLDASGVQSGAASATGAIGRIDTALKEATEVANLYSVSITTAERALTILSAPIGQATANLTELDAAMDLAQQETKAATAANQAYAASLTESAAAIMAEGAEMEALGGLTARTSTTLRALGIETSAVTAKATELGLSLEVAALAMIKIQKAELAGTVKDAALTMEGLTVATAENAAATEASTAMTEADAAALAQRAIMMRRTSDGLVDLALGGSRAVQGVADLQYVLTTLMPEFAGVLAAVGGVALVLELLTSRHRGAGEAAKGHAKSEKGLEEQTDKTTEAIIKQADAISKTHLQVLTDELKEYLKVQEQLIANQDRLDASADAHLQHIQAQTRATQELGLAELKRQEALDLAAASGDEQKQARIKLQYKGKEDAMEGGNEQEANLAEQTLLSQQKQDDDAKRATLLDDQAQNNAKLKALQDDAAAKAAKVQGEGFQPDEAGSFEDRIKAQGDAVKKAAEDYAAAQQTLETANKHVAEALAGVAAAGLTGNASLEAIAKGVLTTEQNKQTAAQAGVADAQKGQIDASTQLADLRDAQTAREALTKQGALLQTSIDKNSAEIDKLVSKLDDIYSRQTVLSTESKTSATKTETAGIENQTDERQTYYKQVDDNAKDLVRKNAEMAEAKKKADALQGKADREGEITQDQTDQSALEIAKAKEAEAKKSIPKIPKGGKADAHDVEAVENDSVLQRDVDEAQQKVQADKARRLAEQQQKAQDDAAKANAAALPPVNTWAPSPAAPANIPEPSLNRPIAVNPSVVPIPPDVFPPPTRPAIPPATVATTPEAIPAPALPPVQPVVPNIGSAEALPAPGPLTIPAVGGAGTPATAENPLPVQIIPATAGVGTPAVPAPALPAEAIPAVSGMGTPAVAEPAPQAPIVAPTVGNSVQPIAAPAPEPPVIAPVVGNAVQPVAAPASPVTDNSSQKTAQDQVAALSRQGTTLDQSHQLQETVLHIMTEHVTKQTAFNASLTAKVQELQRADAAHSAQIQASNTNALV